MAEDTDIAGLIEGSNAARSVVLTRCSRRDHPGVPASVRWLTGIESADDLPEDRRYELAVVFDQLSHMPKSAAIHLIAALRDRYARRVVILDSTLDYGEFLALGFERLPAPVEGYVYDPDSPSRRREWNHAGDWANPENYDKYRW